METKATLKLTSDEEKDQLINEIEREISEMTVKYKAAISERERLQNEQRELLKKLIS